MLSKISSTNNPQIKKTIALRESKERKITGLTIVDGFREVMTAKQAGVPFKKIFVCPEILEKSHSGAFEKEFLRSGLDVFEVTKQVLAKLSFGDRLEGIVAVVQPPVRKIEDLTIAESPLYIVLEALEKPGNLGAILRTSDAAGVDALFVCRCQTDIFNPNVIRASLGTIFNIPVIEAQEEDILKFFKQRKITIGAAKPDGKLIYTKANLKNPLALAFGEEHHGLSKFWIKQAHLSLKIPMRGMADSLNVSTSAAILIYEAIRQRSV